MSKPETSPDNGSSYGSLIKWTLAAAAVGIVGGVVVRSLLRCSSDKPALKPTKMKEKAKKPQKEIDVSEEEMRKIQAWLGRFPASRYAIVQQIMADGQIVEDTNIVKSGVLLAPEWVTIIEHLGLFPDKCEQFLSWILDNDISLEKIPEKLALDLESGDANPITKLLANAFLAFDSRLTKSPNHYIVDTWNLWETNPEREAHPKVTSFLANCLLHGLLLAPTYQTNEEVELRQKLLATDFFQRVCEIGQAAAVAGFGQNSAQDGVMQISSSILAALKRAYPARLTEEEAMTLLQLTSSIHEKLVAPNLLSHFTNIPPSHKLVSELSTAFMVLRTHELQVCHPFLAVTRQLVRHMFGELSQVVSTEAVCEAGIATAREVIRPNLRASIAMETKRLAKQHKLEHLANCDPFKFEMTIIVFVMALQTENYGLANKKLAWMKKLLENTTYDTVKRLQHLVAILEVSLILLLAQPSSSFALPLDLQLQIENIAMSDPALSTAGVLLLAQLKRINPTTSFLNTTFSVSDLGAYLPWKIKHNLSQGFAAALIDHLVTGVLPGLTLYFKHAYTPRKV